MILLVGNLSGAIDPPRRLDPDNERIVESLPERERIWAEQAKLRDEAERWARQMGAA